MNEAIKKNGLTFGLIVGVAAILITTIIYVIDLGLMVSIGVGLSIFAINIVIGIIGVAKTKKQLGGFISFKQALGAFVLIMAIGSLINILFNILLFNIIDPAAKETMTTLVVEKTVSMMQNFGAKAEDIKKTIVAMKETDNFGPFSLLKSYLSSMVMYIIIGLIVAVALRNKKEVFN
ncbi:DUF4199 domain-containing protein [Flavobacterium sp. RHBU_24]|uniref:DUF4199 domain-containing protein n=1 Tax=Flavobacterium sp. RHBU_24 TaxID=3391185 RepID=UPI003984BA20